MKHHYDFYDYAIMFIKSLIFLVSLFVDVILIENIKNMSITISCFHSIWDVYSLLKYIKPLGSNTSTTRLGSLGI